MALTHQSIGEEKRSGMRKTPDDDNPLYDRRPVGDALSNVLGNLEAFSAIAAATMEALKDDKQEVLGNRLEIYRDQLIRAIDEITYHLGKLGFSAIVTVTDLGLFPNGETGEGLAARQGMMAKLTSGHRAVRISFLAAVDVAEEADDFATVKLLRHHLNAQEEQMNALSALSKTYVLSG